MSVCVPEAVVYWYVLGRSAESRPFTAFSVFVLIAETTIFACDSIDAASVAETVSEPPAVIVRTEDVVSIQASAWLETLLLASAAPVALVVAPHFALIAKSFVATSACSFPRSATIDAADSATTERSPATLAVESSR